MSVLLARREPSQHLPKQSAGPVLGYPIQSVRLARFYSLDQRA